MSRWQTWICLLTFALPLRSDDKDTLEFWRIAYVTSDEVAFTLQSKEQLALTFELKASENAPIAKQLTTKAEGVSQMHIGGLSANTSYELSLRDTSGVILDRGSVTTAPNPRSAEELHFVLAGEVPDLQTASSLELYAAALQSIDPQLNLWLGNGLATQQFSWSSPMAYDEAASSFAQTPALAHLGKKLPQLHILGGSDYGPPGSNRHWSGRVSALKTYGEYWPSPFLVFPEHPGIFQLRYGDVEFFALDAFSQRDGFEKAPEIKTVFDSEQINWLINALATSDATFKLILSPFALLNPRTDEAALNHFKRAQESFLRALRNPPAEGVIILSASDGAGEITRYIRPDGYPLFELSVGHLLHDAEPPKLYPETNYFRIPGTLVREPHFASVEVSGPIGARKISLTLRHLDGRIIRTESIRASDLRN
jgi:hypothetical protein